VEQRRQLSSLAAGLAIIALMLAEAGLMRSSAYVSEASGACHMYFIVYGEPWCPACKEMKSFIEKNYGSKCLEFRSIEEAGWRKNYDDLVSLLKLDAYVPLTGLVVNGRLVGIAQGVVEDKAFWSHMASTPANSTSIPVYGYRSDKLITESIKVSMVEEYFTPGEEASATTSKHNVRLILVPALILVAIIAALWVRWRR